MHQQTTAITISLSIPTTSLLHLIKAILLAVRANKGTGLRLLVLKTQ